MTADDLAALQSMAAAQSRFDNTQELADALVEARKQIIDLRKALKEALDRWEDMCESEGRSWWQETLDHIAKQRKTFLSKLGERTW